MQSRTRVSLEKVIAMMRNLLEGINIMHGKMIMHRDIKPDNILIDEGGTLSFPFSSKYRKFKDS